MLHWELDRFARTCFDTCLSFPDRIVVGPQFPRLGPTPNGSYPGDVLVNNLTNALNTSLTDPRGNGWFDRQVSPNRRIGVMTARDRRQTPRCNFVDEYFVAGSCELRVSNARHQRPGSFRPKNVL